MLFDRVGCQNSATGLDLGFFAARWYSWMRPPRTAVLDPLLGEVGGGFAGPGRAELAAARGSSSVVVPGMLGEDRPQVAFTEDQHPIGDLGPGGEHETFRIGIRARGFGAGSSRLRCRRR